MFQDHFLSYRRFAYLKVASLLVLGAGIAYSLDEPPVPPNGGTVLGYVLGTIAGLLCLWLLWFGVRKRAYRSDAGVMRGWLSAHVYLGLAVLIVATLHAGFQMSWTLHGLTYVLLVAVVASGMTGIWMYVRYPGALSEVLDGKTPDALAREVAELDERSAALASECPGPVRAALAAAAAGPLYTRFWQPYTGRNRGCATAAALRAITASGATKPVQRAYELVAVRQQLLQRLRTYVRLRKRAELWLLFHVPLSLGLIGALIAHVVSVFFYW